MTSLIADDHASIKARMEEIAKERDNPAGHDTGVIEPKEVSAMPYLGMDIYAPVNLSASTNPWAEIADRFFPRRAPVVL